MLGLRRAGAVALALAALAVPAASAQASTVSVVAGKLTFEDTAGDENYVDMFGSDLPDGVSVVDYGADLIPGPGCAPVGDPTSLPDLYYTVECAAVSSIELSLGGGYDEAWIGLDLPVTGDGGDGADYIATFGGDDELDGGPGDDVLQAGGGADTVRGGDGDDVVRGDSVFFDDDDEGGGEGDGGTPGVDTVEGGAGDDVLSGGPMADHISGGDGSDRVSYFERSAPVTVTLDGAANDGEAGENDEIAGDVEGVSGGYGADHLVGEDGNGSFFGNGGNDVIEARGGNDLLVGGDGEDSLDAGAGDDTLMSAEDPEEGFELAVDHLECGDGQDKVTADPSDVVGASCEGVERTKPPTPSAPPTVVIAPPAPVTPAGVSLAAKRLKKHLRTVRISGALTLPAGADPKVCVGLGAVIEVYAKKKRVATRPVLLDATCAFKATVKLPRKRLVALARFTGSSTVSPAISKRIKVRRK